MARASSIEPQAESVLEILAAQCADLEDLLDLARRETTAAEQGNFEELMRITSVRATLGERLEVYHRQIAEMRARMGEAGEPAFRSAMAERAVALAVDIQTQDARTRPLLAAHRDEAAAALAHLSQTRRHVSAYLRDGRSVSVACDQRV
jgi:hypothetical protein